MAMTGVRRVTTDLGLVRKPPPERIATEGIPGLFARLAPEHPEIVIELCHWGVGAVGGIGFRIFPAALRGRRWAGPAYGLAILAVFETAIAPGLGIAARDRTVSERLAWRETTWFMGSSWDENEQRLRSGRCSSVAPNGKGRCLSLQRG
jgi:hypothetical protein